jgi:hypothetical protein
LGGLREIAEQHLNITLEGRFGLPVELIGPDGIPQIYSENDPTTLLQAQVLYDTTVQNPETGEEVIIPEPNISLRRSSLVRIPLAGEHWFIKIPETPSATAPKEEYVLSSDLAPQDGRSLGIVRLYLTKAKQS